MKNILVAKRLKYPLLLVCVAIMWSTSGFCVKQIDWNPMAIAGARSGFAAVTVLMLCRKTKIRWSVATITGAVSYALTLLSFIVALKLTTSANAIMLQYTAPIYVAVLGALFLREKPRCYDWLTIGIVAGGMVLFFRDQMAPGGMTGNFVAIFSGVMSAVYAVSMRSQKHGSPFASVLIGHVLAFICGAFFMFSGSPGASGWLIIALLGCLQIGIPSVLYSVAIKHVTALEASIITMVEPLLNPIWVFLIIGEQPGQWALAGGAIILLAIGARYILPEIISSGREATK
ncbi:MAG: DMT family transporter [Negativicutes bacterium]|jgi:drug/metabolite transporter (DMT)-like permease